MKNKKEVRTEDTRGVAFLGHSAEEVQAVFGLQAKYDYTTNSIVKDGDCFNRMLDGAKTLKKGAFKY